MTHYFIDTLKHKLENSKKNKSTYRRRSRRRPEVIVKKVLTFIYRFRSRTVWERKKRILTRVWDFNLNYYEWFLIRNKRRATGSPTSLQQLLIQDYCSLFYTLSFFLSEKQYNLSKMNSYSKKCTTAWTSLKYQSTHQRLSKDQSPKTTNFTKSLERKARKNKTIFGAKKLADWY